MTNVDLESIRQFIVNDEEIRKYFLALTGNSLVGREISGRSAQGAREFPEGGSARQASPELELENYARAQAAQAAQAQEIAALRGELRAVQEKASSLERECTRLREEAARAQAREKAALERLSVFEPIRSAMEIYASMDEKSKAAMKNIFRSGAPDGFICCGAQKDSLANLWDYGRTLAVYGSEECLKVDQLFGYFVSLYNLNFPQPVYTLIEPREGDRFDEDVHVCLMHGRRIPAVSTVLLRGYRVNGKTVNKALVK